jgi:hypothetical protein
MAQEFTEADLSPQFRSNGTANPEDAAYQALAARGFQDWKLLVDGLVQAPAEFTLAQLRAMPSRTQITRHDCVEGWSAIGKWTGVQLSHMLALSFGCSLKPAMSSFIARTQCGGLRKNTTRASTWKTLCTRRRSWRTR